jgi:hypothetical protein
MTTCNKCRKDFRVDQIRCPHCGEPNSEAAGTFQTSTVLISVGGADRIYRSVDEVPARLRTRLLKSTNGSNSATILIADQRGRKEIARAMRKLPGQAQRRIMHSVFGATAPGGQFAWLTPRRRKAILAVLAMFVLALTALVFTHRWQ